MKDREITTLKSSEIDLNMATPMLKQFLDIKLKYQDMILLYRMGDFFETFFEDAITVAKDLEITLTSREGGALGRIPMAGVPAKAVDSYIAKLLQKNHKIAVCDQTQDPAEAKGLVERKVTRLITAGTLSDPNLIDSNKNNYLAAITKDKNKDLYGLAYVDITTAEFRITQTNLSQLISELNCIKPSEILAPTKKQKIQPFQIVPEETPDLDDEILRNFNCTKCSPSLFDEKFAQKIIKETFNVSSLECFGYPEFSLGLISAGVILDYIRETQKQNIPKFDVISPYTISEFVSIDANTRKNLELTETSRDKNKKGSLLWAINRTSTNMGARLLSKWIHQPLQNLIEINKRQDAVEELLQDSQSRIKLTSLLDKVYDIERLSTKISNNSVNARDFLALKDSLENLPMFKELLKDKKSPYLSVFNQDYSQINTLCGIIEKTIADNPPISIKEGNLIKQGVHEELDYQRSLLSGGKEWIENFEKKEKERTNIKSLKIGYSKTFGYFIEVTHANAEFVPSDYTRKQTLVNAERYITPELKKYEEEVLSAQSKSVEIEYKIFCDLREYSKEYVTALREISHNLASLDVLLSFAIVASEHKYIRPYVDNSNALIVKGGRHPVIEQLLPMGEYVANDLCIYSGAEENSDMTQFIILTGPNMAGKSTYMRQNALIILLAQMGSFVPAEEAHIGIIDKIFTRVGSVDDLSTGQSTFMVEMNETAMILNSATEKSLILLDEIGRGTSTYDGVAIAWSVAEFIATKIKARTIFATHYHELNIMCNSYPYIKNYRMTIEEKNGEIKFLRRVVPGGTSRSYGIQVAKMAGLPEDVISNAMHLMQKMQKNYATKLGITPAKQDSETPQLSLFIE